MCLFFFFFKQKTAYEMRISDWSSDVCSSDLSALSVPLSSPREANGAAAPAIVLSAATESVMPLTPAGSAVGPTMTKSLYITGLRRSAERRVGNECVSTCSSRWSPYNYKQTTPRQDVDILHRSANYNTY